ncbi:hypothetical protein GALL_464420 [mine drainage metagenome]|uniref:Uncharacterized protein n=1 Tax=mine drainage metagenome TaxID=410659 RepID=A0A1J5PK67_9ZZZZ
MSAYAGVSCPNVAMTFIDDSFPLSAVLNKECVSLGMRAGNAHAETEASEVPGRGGLFAWQPLAGNSDRTRWSASLSDVSIVAISLTPASPRPIALAGAGRPADESSSALLRIAIRVDRARRGNESVRSV